MNLMLFEPQELENDCEITVTDHRATHLIEVLQIKPQQTINAGITNGCLGSATVLSVEKQQVRLHWETDRPPPPPVECTVILSLPRPKMLRRVLQNLSSMGIKEIHLINSWKVEKSYWQSPHLSEGALYTELLTGLAQSVDTVLPKIHLHKLFKPFAQDILPALCHDKRGLVAHPYHKKKCPIDIQTPSILAIGPEGGFTDYEINLLTEAGLEAVNIGARILRVETAIPAIISRLYPA